MTLPETDLHRIHTWARGRVPEHLWPELKVEADVADRYVDIVEVRPSWDGVGENTRFPIARLRYTKSTGRWAIYWRDRHPKLHEHKRKRPTKNVQALLDYVETSGPSSGADGGLWTAPTAGNWSTQVPHRGRPKSVRGPRWGRRRRTLGSW